MVSHANRCAVITHFGFNLCLLPMNNNVDHISMCHQYIFFSDISIQMFDALKIRVLVFLLLHFEVSLYI